MVRPEYTVDMLCRGGPTSGFLRMEYGRGGLPWEFSVCNLRGAASLGSLLML